MRDFNAGFGRRAGAFLLDLSLVMILVEIVYLFFALFGVTSNYDAKQKDMVTNILNVILGWLYFAGFESSSGQATFGKVLFQISVTDLEGNRISFFRATVRYFTKFVSALILFAGFIMALFTERKQGLHDKIAKTIVVQK